MIGLVVFFVLAGVASVALVVVVVAGYRRRAAHMAYWDRVGLANIAELYTQERPDLERQPTPAGTIEGRKAVRVGPAAIEAGTVPRMIGPGR